MITNSENPKFKAYAAHVLKWEGSMDDDPHDRASSCIPGKIHTVRGVTYCVFKARAAKLGITPVTHERFVRMTADDARKFIYDEYTNNPWINLPDASALAMTEASWGSGSYAWNNAIDTLKALNIAGVPAKRSNLGYTNAEKKKIIELANKVPEKKFFDTFWQIRYDWLDRLGKTAYGAKYRRGWLNRQNEFKKLRDTLVQPSGGGFFFGIVLLGSFIAYRMLKKG